MLGWSQVQREQEDLKDEPDTGSSACLLQWIVLLFGLRHFFYDYLIVQNIILTLRVSDTRHRWCGSFFTVPQRAKSVSFFFNIILTVKYHHHDGFCVSLASKAWWRKVDLDSWFFPFAAKTSGSATPGVSSSPVMPTSPDSTSPILALEDVKDTIQAVQANRVALGLDFDQEC